MPFDPLGFLDYIKKFWIKISLVNQNLIYKNERKLLKVNYILKQKKTFPSIHRQKKENVFFSLNTLVIFFIQYKAFEKLSKY